MSETVIITQVTAISDTEIQVVTAGIQGPTGPAGTGSQGPAGPAGPNSITASTATTLTGILKGAGGLITVLASFGVADGGTGLTSYAQGDIIYASAANTLATLAKNTTAQRVLTNGGTNNNPVWAQVNLVQGVSGTLPVANGGTNSAATPTTGALMYYNGTAIVAATETISSAGGIEMHGKFLYMNTQSTTSGGGAIRMDGGNILRLNLITDANSIDAFDVGGRIISDSSGTDSVNADFRTLSDSSLNVKIDYTGFGPSGAALQFDGAGNIIFGFSIYDTSSNISLDTNSRHGFASDGITEIFDYSSASQFQILVPTYFPSLNDSGASNSSLYYSNDQNALAWKDSLGTVNPLYTAGGGISGTGAMYQIAMFNGTSVIGSSGMNTDNGGNFIDTNFITSYSPNGRLLTNATGSTAINYTGTQDTNADLSFDSGRNSYMAGSLTLQGPLYSSGNPINTGGGAINAVTGNVDAASFSVGGTAGFTGTGSTCTFQNGICTSAS
jgi:hypothetical protein